MFYRHEGEFIIVIVNECEKMRGAAEVKLISEIRKLRKVCKAKSPNQRLVANLVTGLDATFNLLIDNHVSLMMKMNTALSFNVGSALSRSSMSKFCTQDDLIS